MTVDTLIEYMLVNHMYSKLLEVQRIIGKERADKSTRNAYVLGVPSYYGLCDIVAFLINRGFVVNATKSQNGFTALHEAAVSGEVEVVKLLLHHKADASICDKLGETPLDKARFFQRKEVMILLTN